MRPTFLARLVNGPLFDPVVLVRLLNLKTSLLFDCGRVEGIANRDILRVDAVFISHTHMDHFLGFDHVLRTVLHRQRPLAVYGPEGIRDRVISRLHSYTWNLTEEYPLEIVIHEVSENGISLCRACARDGFRPSPQGTVPRTSRTIAACGRYSVEASVLDHNGIPCLGFVLQEPFHVNIRADAVRGGGYLGGAWIGDFKGRLMEGRTDEAVTVPTEAGPVRRRVGELAGELATVSPGQKIAFITDVCASDENIRRIVEIARGVDTLFIEAYYLHERQAQAAAKGHLTAAQAGMIARMARARKVVPMHVSPRHHDRLEEVVSELEAAMAAS